MRGPVGKIGLSRTKAKNIQPKKKLVEARVEKGSGAGDTFPHTRNSVRGYSVDQPLVVVPRDIPNTFTDIAGGNILANLCTDAFRQATKADIAFTANGMMRAPLTRGKSGIQTVYDVFRVAPLGAGVVDTTAGSSCGEMPTAMASENSSASITGRCKTTLMTKMAAVSTPATCTDRGDRARRGRRLRGRPGRPCGSTRAGGPCP